MVFLKILIVKSSLSASRPFLRFRSGTALLFQILKDRFSRGSPVTTNSNALNVAFANAFSDVVFRKAAELRSLLHRDQVSETVR